MLDLLSKILSDVVYKDPTSLLWIMILGLVLCIMTGFGSGANDVANTFGTSVGSGAITFKYAIILASIFEFSGAILLGGRVADTIRGGISDPKCFENSEALYMVVMLVTLFSVGLWCILASILGLPVSTTHGIVGAIIGSTLPLKGPKCVQWGLGGMGRVFISWVVSPLLSGLISFTIFFLIQNFVIKSRNPVRASLIVSPFLFGIATFFLVALIFWDYLVGPAWITIIITVMCSLIVGINVNTFVIPFFKRKISEIDSHTTIQDNLEHTGENTEEHKYYQVQPQDEKVDEENLETATEIDKASIENQKSEVAFRYLQIFTACIASFAHGSNDTGNAIGPFAAIWFLWRDGRFESKSIPMWIVAIGGLSIVLGLSLLGRRVIKTMGEDITRINFVNGFSSEISSSMAVVLASRLGLPVSSTHCQVGAITGVGIVGSGIKNVDWKVLGKIGLSWIVTLPVCGLLGAGLSYAISFTVRAK